MKTRNSALFTLGLAAAITLGGAVTAAAQQDTTGRARSQRRIPVRKDQGTQAAVAPRVDTVTVTRSDTVIVRRTDTVTVTRVDTVTKIEELPLQPLKSFQFGLGVGAALPTGDWRNVAKDGYDLHAHLGLFPGAGPVGLRIDGDWAAMGGRETDCSNCPGAKLISGSANLVVRFPMDRKSPVNPQIYFLGGGGIDKFTDFTAYRTTEKSPKIVTAGKDTYVGTGSIVNATTAGTKSSFYHWDFGGGIQLSKLFIEAKYVSINTTGKNSAYVPILIGLNF
jgi:hypothetical protein